MAQKTRSELQGLFQTGAKPSQQDFADFIESTLNIKDDGIEKPSSANSPLKITAQGTDEKLLDFYAGDKNTWSISQKLGGNKIGLNISNSEGSKLFIDSGSGNVGLSIDQPTAKLHIQQTGNEDALRIDDELKDTTPFLINKDGNVGIGTPSPIASLDIASVTRTDAANHPKSVKGLYITGDFAPDSNGVEFRHTNGTQGIGFGYNTIYATGSIANQDLNLKAKGTGQIACSGNLTVSGSLSLSSSPTSTRKLEINGDIGGLSFEVGAGSPHSGMIRFGDKTGWKLHFGRSRERSDGTLNSGTQGLLMTIQDNGNVGIGTTTPGVKLEVKGSSKDSSAAGLNVTDSDAKSLLYVRNDGNVGIRTTSPEANLTVVGTATISDGNHYATKKGFMASGSLTIGSIEKNYGGETKPWRDNEVYNAAGLLLETKANTEIAVHDSNTRLASLMYYEGDSTNRITIGRDMGWGAIDTVSINGKISSPKWNLTQILNCKDGSNPLALNGVFKTGGGTLLIFVSGSGYSDSNNKQIGIEIKLDTTVIGKVCSFTNEWGSHKAFIMAPLVVTNISQGQHNLTLSLLSNTRIDDNDFFNVTVLELPF